MIRKMLAMLFALLFGLFATTFTFANDSEDDDTNVESSNEDEDNEDEDEDENEDEDNDEDEDSDEDDDSRTGHRLRDARKELRSELKDAHQEFKKDVKETRKEFKKARKAITMDGLKEKMRALPHDGLRLILARIATLKTSIDNDIVKALLADLEAHIQSIVDGDSIEDTSGDGIEDTSGDGADDDTDDDDNTAS